MKEQLKRIFLPNKSLNKQTTLIMVGIQITFALIFWIFMTDPLIPKPGDIVTAFFRLVAEDGLIYELGKSMQLGLESLVRTIFISLILAYATVLPFFRPTGFIVSKLRFLTLVGLSFLFTVYTGGGEPLKVALLVFAMSVFFIPGAINIVNGVSRNSLNHARTLRMNEWEVVYRKQILGTLDQMFELIRQNFAIAWMMLTMVEGLVRSGGGAGTMLLNENKHFHLDAVFAIQISILIIGITLDYIIGVLKNLFCPHAKLVLDRK